MLGGVSSRPAGCMRDQAPSVSPTSTLHSISSPRTGVGQGTPERARRSESETQIWTRVRTAASDLDDASRARYRELRVDVGRQLIEPLGPEDCPWRSPYSRRRQRGSCVPAVGGEASGGRGFATSGLKPHTVGLISPNVLSCRARPPARLPRQAPAARSAKLSSRTRCRAVLPRSERSERRRQLLVIGRGL